MADKTISELVRATQITATDLFVLEQNATAKCLTGQILINWLTSYADGHGGIQSIAKTSTSGLVDTYTVTLSDTTTYTFTVTNGAKGDTGAASYVHIRYAAQQPTRDADMGTVPDKWIGIYSGTSSTAPAHYTSYTWYQYKGETGATGAAATLSSSSITYQEGTSSTTAPTGTWTANIPTVAQGNFLWTKTVITFNSGSPITYYAVSRQGIDGSGAVSTVNGKSPTSGNVQLDGADINVNDSASPTLTVKAAIESAQNSISSLNTTVGNLSTDKQDKILSRYIILRSDGDGWSGHAQTVSVAGVTVSNHVIVSPAPVNFGDYTQAGIFCANQGAGTLTFACTTDPDSNIGVNVLIVG